MTFGPHGLDEEVLRFLGHAGLQGRVEGDHQIDMGLLIPTRHFAMISRKEGLSGGTKS